MDFKFKGVVKNFLSLSGVQLLNYAVPILVIPYLIRIIGVDNFGLITFAYAVINYFIISAEFGYNLIATKDVSNNRDSAVRLSIITSRVLLTKLFLCIILFLFLVLLILVIPRFYRISTLLVSGYLIVLASVFNPMWFFQGIEKMQFITLMNALSKILFLILVLSYITEKTDYIYYLFFIGFSNFVSALISLIYINRYYNIFLKKVTISDFKKELLRGWEIFLSNLANTSFINSNVIILAFFVGNTQLGYYGIAEKVLLSIRQILGSFTASLYPRACTLAKEGIGELMSLFRGLFVPFQILVLGGSLLLLFISDYVIYILAGRHIEMASLYLKLLAVIPIISALNNPGYISLLAFNHKKVFSQILILGGVINIALNILLAYSFDVFGTIGAIFLTELFITTMFLIIPAIKYGINFKYLLIND